MDAPACLTLGTQNLDALRAALDASGVRRNAYGEALLASGRVRVAAEPRQVRVLVHTVGELGWGSGAPMEEVLREVAARGLAPCPLEVALHLRLAWRGQAVSPRITVASVPPADEREPSGFYLLDDPAGCWLRAYVASHDWVMPAEERLALLG